jgi:hypothetical protein
MGLGTRMVKSAQRRTWERGWSGCTTNLAILVPRASELAIIACLLLAVFTSIKRYILYYYLLPHMILFIKPDT